MEHKLVQRLLAYEDFCNRYAVDAAIDLFTPDGCVVVAGVPYGGRDTLWHAHDFDRGNKTVARYGNFGVEGDRVVCTFDVCDELDRVVGIDGWHMKAEFTFVGDKIACFRGLFPTPQEIARHRRIKHSFEGWARATHFDEWAKAFAFMPSKGFTGFDFELGALRTKLAREWMQHSHA